VNELAERIKKLRFDINTRMMELAPLVDEADRLKETLEIVEFAIGQRDELNARLTVKTATRRNVDRWASTLDFDEVVRTSDLADEFNKYAGWGRNHLVRLENEGVLEKWGKGQWRRKPERTGTATLKVVTK
jgi:hypothetical protein